MANKVKVTLNRAGVRELLRSEWAMSVCAHYAEAAADKLGQGYEVSRFTGKNRVNASIEAVSQAARAENASDNTILKAIRG